MVATAKKVERAPVLKAKDVTALLRADHKEVNDLFNEYETVKSFQRKRS